MDKELSEDVQMQFMRPAQLEAAARAEKYGGVVYPPVFFPHSEHNKETGELVDMNELGTGPLAPDMKPPDGIGGLDPRTHASALVGGRNVEHCSGS